MVDKDYRDVSYIVYKIDNTAKERINIKEGKNILEEKYQVLSLEDNQNNGMQAMAVAPVNERGEVDTRRIVIAYAGTNFADSNDRDTDIQNVIMGLPVVTIKNYFYNIPEVKLNQIETAVYFAKKIKEKYPKSIIDTTGHSLGGYLAMVVAIRNRWETTVFNAPDPSNMLSEKEIKWARANTHLLVNYRNYRDVIGNFGGNPLGIARYVNMGLAEDDVFIPKDTVEFYKYLVNIPTQYHALATWKFDKYGNLINIKGDIVNPETSVRSIDIDGDGINDIPLKAGDLRLTNLLSERGDISISGEKIQLNPEVLRILSSNIRIKVINDLATIKRITKLCIEKNNKVRMDFNQRKEQVTESIKEELNNTEMPFILDNLRESVGEITKNKHLLEVLQQKYQLNMEQFSSNEIPLVSGIRLYPYNYNIQLDTLRRATAPLLSQSQKEETRDISNLFRGKPTILKSWQEIENNTKRLLEESDKTFEGDGLRTGKEDGISQSLKQVLEVAGKNIEELEKQLQNTAELTQGLAENFEEQDRWIGTKLQQGTFVGSNPVKNMPQSYKAYLERDEIFDDVKDVIQAFDKQVEKRSEEYSAKLTQIMGENLDAFSSGLENWSVFVDDAKRAIVAVEGNYPLTVEVAEKYTEEYQEEGETKTTTKTRIRYWGEFKRLYPETVVDNITDIQDKIISKKAGIVETIQVIKTTQNNLGYLEPNLKKIIEEGIYKAFDLDEIVNSQKIVKRIIEKSQSEIKYVKEHIGTEGMSGEAIKALNQKLEEVNRSLEYYKMFIGDCFGDQA